MEQPKELKDWIGKRVTSTYDSNVRGKVGTVYCVIHNQLGIQWDNHKFGHNGFNSGSILAGVNKAKDNKTKDCWFCTINTCTIVEEVPKDQIVNNYELW